MLHSLKKIKRYKDQIASIKGKKDQYRVRILVANKLYNLNKMDKIYQKELTTENPNFKIYI